MTIDRESIRTLWRSGHDGADLARRLGLDRHEISFSRPSVEVAGVNLAAADKRPFSFLRRWRASLATKRRAAIPKCKATIEGVPGLRIQWSADQCHRPSLSKA